MTDIPVGSKVELLEGFSDIYQSANAGATAYVRNRKRDSYDYAMVYVEWDKDNWRYGGEDDGWAFESHFKLIEDADDVLRRSQQMLNDIVASAKQRREDEKCPSCGGEHDTGVKQAEKFINVLLQACEAIESSEGFFVVTVKADRTDPNRVVYMPELYGGHLHDDIVPVLEGQVVAIAAKTMRDWVEERLKEV